MDTVWGQHSWYQTDPKPIMKSIMCDDKQADLDRFQFGHADLMDR